MRGKVKTGKMKQSDLKKGKSGREAGVLQQAVSHDRLCCHGTALSQLILLSQETLETMTSSVRETSSACVAQVEAAVEQCRKGVEQAVANERIRGEQRLAVSACRLNKHPGAEFQLNSNHASIYTVVTCT